MMIYKVEEKFEELFATVPTQVLSDPLIFSYGEEKALNQLLAGRYDSGMKSYPLLWYKLPNKVMVGKSNVRGDFEFILATNTTEDLYNDQRMKQNFAKILYPNLELVLQAFQGANNITLNQINGKQYYESSNYPAFGTPTEDANKTIDYWDAVLFKVNLIINNNCFLPIRYNTNNII